MQFTKIGQINKKSLVDPMIFKCLDLKTPFLGQKTFKTTFSQKYSIQGKNVKKKLFLKEVSFFVMSQPVEFWQILEFTFLLLEGIGMFTFVGYVVILQFFLIADITLFG